MSSSASSSSYSMWIGGRSIRSASRLFDVLNPFDGSVVAQAPSCTRAELDEAVSSARKAFPQWRTTSWEGRQKTLKKMAQALIKNKDELARTLTLEQGKGLPQSEAEILGSAAWLNFAASHGDPSKIMRDTPKDRVVQKYEPIGVVGAIVAWNFPVILIHFKIAQALLAGCTVVLKSSEHTPLSALQVGRIYNEILPAGVFNVITSENPEMGRWLVEHPEIDKVSFTGSTATGKKIVKGASESLKRVTLELGGNDAGVVLDDVDPVKVAPYLFRGAFMNSGQVCLAIKRLYVHENIYEDVVKELAKQAQNAPFGDGTKKGIVFGPVNNAMQYEKVRSLLVDALEHGAEIAAGEVPPPLSETKGFMFKPTILKNVKEGMRVVDEEQFGPILPVLKFMTIDEAVERANRSQYGLGASVWAKDIDKAEEVASKLEAGTTWVNAHGDIVDDVPFGGAKMSGIGHEGGKEGLLAFMQMKIVKTKKQSKL